MDTTMNTNKTTNWRDVTQWQFKYAYYEITHRKTGITYVGYTTVGVQRWWFHLDDTFTVNKNTPFCNALRQEGAEAFTWRITPVGSAQEAIEGELRTIAEYVNALKPVYNQIGTTRYGFGPHGRDNPHVLPESVLAAKRKTLSAPTTPSQTREAPPTKARKTLTLQEIGTVIDLVGKGHSQRKIAALLDVAQSTISKTLSRVSKRTK